MARLKPSADEIGTAIENLLAFGTEPPEADPAVNRHRVAVAQADPWRLCDDIGRHGMVTGKRVFNRQTTFQV